MRIDIRVTVYATLVGALAGVLAWFEYYPVSPMITTIGLPGPRANADRECGTVYRQVIHGTRIPTRELVCRGPRKVRADLVEDQDVTLDALTRAIGHVRRFWGMPDSASWQNTRDSVTSVMTKLGGRPISCRWPPASSLPNVRDVQFWRFESYSIRFISYRTVDKADPRSPWLLQLDGYPSLPSECVMDPWRSSR